MIRTTPARQIPVSAKQTLFGRRAMYSDMRFDVYFAGRNAYRYISLFMPKSVFFADTGMPYMAT